jgi:hypothetical protein
VGRSFRADTCRQPTDRSNRKAMTTEAMVTFGVIAGLVWGGFLFIIITAFRKESRKTGEG